MLILLLCILAGAMIVGIIVLAAILGWGGPMPWPQRLGLCAVAAGLVGASPDRFLQRPVGLFDLILLAGLVLYLAASYGAAIARRADALDGRPDGRLQPPWLRW